MINAFGSAEGRLEKLAGDASLRDAVWIDLYQPQPAQVAEIEALGIRIPTLAEMEEIEISSRLYRENGVDYMTAVLPGLTPEGARTLGPVTFILNPDRLVTVRHHVPHPFETYPERAGHGALDTSSVEGLFLGLVDEIIARFADILEAVGHTLDELSAMVFSEAAEQDTAALRDALKTIGRQGERAGRVRLGLLSMERVLSFYSQTLRARGGGEGLSGAIEDLQRDISALGVHADFISSRLGMLGDSTMGMINLAQNQSVQLFSILAVLFLPPTLVASIYGMNFRNMPELGWPYGYAMALVLMVVSALASYLFFKWKKWL